ncbi:GNAT family N-acetyltransferase [Kineosporia succinea]|uniref:GNAT superfamily N-acetyltransferase n=1 Tax=Kineosporia succinea TaxID=84632 RepID=A0ABT9PAM6_9ACTN|nr:GNAT family N-acetyltransferase [Kineosporia succinea]MDP9829734.1 GNAT superfamily N-acetyltransferase [Kineosporia succinea]
MTGGRVRVATLSDLDALIELRTEMFRATGEHTAHPEWPGRAARWFTARIDHPDHHLSVVEVQGQAVACALGSLSESQPRPARPFGLDLHVSNVVTLPEFRGRGHAGAALRAVLDWGRSRPGPVRARLFATPEGKSLYEREGFRVSAWPSMGAELS